MVEKKKILEYRCNICGRVSLGDEQAIEHAFEHEEVRETFVKDFGERKTDDCSDEVQF